jgi:superfamily II DNA or RNA helicase
MSQSDESIFVPGLRVQDQRDTARIGTVQGPPERVGGMSVVKVLWDNRSQAQIPVRFLAVFTESTDLWGLLRGKRFGGIEDLARNFTHRKLLNPVDDTLYSLHASRTRLLAHQFKPLLKFLDSVHRRFLIADEVGLGKTIEAGIILSELRARDSLGGVLILCPNHLRDKWRSELQRRFDETFEVIASRRNVEKLIEHAEEEGTLHRRVIIGQKTLTSKRLLQRLRAGAPAFDLIIVDEAHHYKNPETISRKVLGELSDAGNQVLLLTATPIQTHRRNLLSLLRILDHRAFATETLFEERLQANQRIVTADRILRSNGGGGEYRTAKAETALSQVDGIPRSDLHRFGLDTNPDFLRARELLAAAVGEPTTGRLADASEALRAANLLSPYITRTRKVEVQETCTRNVESIRPDLHETETRFYERTVTWFRSLVEERHGEQSVLFLSRGFERRLASSLPAFARHLLDGGSFGGKLSATAPAHVLEAARALAGRDSKLGHLVALLTRLRRDDPEAKFIIFASYRATLRYLSRELRRGGWEHEVIHGDVPMVPDDPARDERGRRVRRFLEDDRCTVLLSSNVGGEGLDLQRASVVINYDLPWNPATLEQRIGRVDRYGQEREIIRVVNFVLPETVEDLIYTRLYDRVDMFARALGDFSEILGRIVSELTLDFFRTELSGEEWKQRMNQAAWRVEQERVSLESVLKQEAELIAFDDDFADELRRRDQRAQSIRPRDLQQVIDGLLQRLFPSSWLIETDDGDADGLLRLRLDPTLLQYLRQRLQTRDSGPLSRLIQRAAGEGTVLVTFDGAAAEQNPDVLLLTSRHPFVRFLVDEGRKAADFHPVSSVLVTPPGGWRGEPGILSLVSGTFAYGPQLRRYLLPVWVHASGIAGQEESRTLLRTILDQGRNHRPGAAPDGDALVSMVEQARDAADALLSELRDRVVARERSRIQPRIEELEDRYRRRAENAGERIAEIEASADLEAGERDRLLRRQRGYMRRVERERQQKIGELSELPATEISVEAVGAVWVEFDTPPEQEGAV